MFKNKSTYIIAEIGVNHNGKVNLASELIKKAKDCGANAVKFQTFNTSNEYNYLHTSSKKINWAKNLELTKKEFELLFNLSNKLKIDFISSPFDIESANFLNKLGVKYFKVASPCLFDIPLLKKISSFNKYVMMSTGMSNFKEIQKASKLFKKNKLCLLYCVSIYPAPYNMTNLNNIDLLRSISKFVGFSDHSTGIELPIASVVKGIHVLEKHFKMSGNYKCPDSKVSISPQKFKSMVESIRNVEISIKKNEKNLLKYQYTSRKNYRKGMYYKIDLKKNHIIKNTDVIFQKPSTNLGIENYQRILGKKLNQKVSKLQEIKLSHLK